MTIANAFNTDDAAHMDARENEDADPAPYADYKRQWNALANSVGCGTPMPAEPIYYRNDKAIAKIRAAGKRMSERSAMRQIFISGMYA
jgi:hypothetical protein